MDTKNITSENILQTANNLRWELGENLHETLTESIYQDAAEISQKVVSKNDEKPRFDWDRTLDHLLTSRITGFPIMLLMLAVVFWLTISGANIPSAMLAIKAGPPAAS